MSKEYEVRDKPPSRGGHRRRPADPYAIAFAKECREHPNSWVRYAPNGDNFQAQHLATGTRDAIYRGGEPWGDDLWEATTRKVRGTWNADKGTYLPEWELWVSYKGRRELAEPPAETPPVAEPDEADPDQPAFPFGRY